MEIKKRKISPLFRKETLLGSSFAYENFLKKRYQIIQKLTIQFKDADYTDLPDRKSMNKVKLLRIFKKIKSIKKADLNDLVIHNARFYHSALLYIAKRMSSISCLRTRDLREYETQYKEFLTSWPKYMKHLKSFHYDAVITEDQRVLASAFLANQNDRVEIEGEEGAKEIKLSTDYLRYLPRLEDFEIVFPWAFDQPTYNLDRVWKLERYPPSLKRLSFNHANYGERPMKTSIRHLKNLKYLKLWFQRASSHEAIKSALNLLLQVSQLECLHIAFPSVYNIEDLACTALRGLKKLKQINLFLEVKKEEDLRILQSLENCPLEDLDLRIPVKSDQNIVLIRDFLMKKKDLRILKLRITKKGAFVSLKEIEDLFETIDDLPQLTSLSIRVRTLKRVTLKEEIYPEIDLSFRKLLSREIPLKKFRISLNQHTFSQNGFMKLLDNLKGVSSNLEKLRIDVGEYKPQSESETDAIISFINDLKKIRSLKLLSVDISARPLFLQLMKVAYELKSLRAFCIGEVSREVTKASFMDGVEKILSKYGLEKFNCRISVEFKRSFLRDFIDYPRLDLTKIRKSNPHLQEWPHHSIFEKLNKKEEEEHSW